MEARKPLAAAESRDPHSIRYSPSEWEVFRVAARLRDQDPSVLVRECSLMGLMMLDTPALMEAYLKHLAVTRRAVNA
jgi:hypothetical protein